MEYEIKLTKQQIEDVQEMLMNENPSSLYGGYAEKGILKFDIVENAEDEKQAKGVLLLLVHGDFDEDEMKPHWVKYTFDDGPIYYLCDSDELDEDGEPYKEWMQELFYYNTIDKQVMNYLVDWEWFS